MQICLSSAWTLKEAQLSTIRQRLHWLVWMTVPEVGIKAWGEPPPFSRAAAQHTGNVGQIASRPP